MVAGTACILQDVVLDGGLHLTELYHRDILLDPSCRLRQGSFDSILLTLVLIPALSLRILGHIETQLSFFDNNFVVILETVQRRCLVLLWFVIHNI